MFILPKLGKNLLEMEGIKKLIWDQVLATKAEIIQSKLYFRFACVLREVTIIYWLDISCFAVFLFFCHLWSAEAIFSSSKKMFPFDFPLSGNNSGFLFTKTLLGVIFMFFGCYGRLSLYLATQEVSKKST